MNKKIIRKGIIVVAGGSGTRMGSELPKQFLILGDKPILMHTLQTVRSLCDELVLVLPSKDIDYWYSLCKTYQFDIKVDIVSGGQTRFDSVKNGLQKIKNKVDLIAIHDGVRPFVTSDTILRLYDKAQQYGAAIPCLPLRDSLRIKNKNGTQAVDRLLYYTVQTPQIFRCDLISSAYETPYNSSFTDDASVFEASHKNPIEIVEGDEINFKITTPIDYQIAQFLISNRK